MANSIVSPKTFITYSLGCRTNQAEVDKICLLLTDYGLQQSEKSPDIVFLNTCVVTAKAEKETRQRIRELRKKYPKSFLVVLGCVVTAKEKFIITLPEADLFIPNEDKDRVVEILEQKFCSLKKFDVLLTFNNPYIQSGRKFIKIQDGCDLFCSFCLTAHLRGKPSSIPTEEIIKEINYWEDKGIKEVILTGINIALYGKEENNKFTIITLLKEILEKTKIEKITLSSIYPEMLLPLTGSNPVNEFIRFVVNNPRISQCFHLSLQSGSQSVIQKMNRETDLKKLSDTLRQIKEINHFFTFRADLIAGFPEETEEEFMETINLIKELKISFVHAFPFSKRIGTQAYEMIKTKKWSDLPMAVKKERVNKIMEMAKEVRDHEGKLMVDSLFHCHIIRKLPCHSRSNRESMKLPDLTVGVSSPHCFVGSEIPPKQKILRIHSRSYNRDFLRRRIKITENISIDSGSKAGMTMYEGITENGWPILVQSTKDRVHRDLKGKILPVKITGFKNDQLLGDIL